MTLQNKPYNSVPTREEYKFIMCGIKIKSIKTYYDILPMEENTTLRFPNFKNRDGILKLVARMVDNQTFGECELHPLEAMRRNDNHPRAMTYWARNIIRSMSWFLRQPAYVEHLIDTTQCCFTSNMPPNQHYTEIHTPG